MKLYFHGHNYKYAAEQMLLTLFPGSGRSIRTDRRGAGEDGLVLSLHLGARLATATAALTWEGRTCRKTRRCPLPDPGDKVARDRAFQHILSWPFTARAPPCWGAEPPWGALTGVRPVKIPTKAMLAGASPRQAERELREVYRSPPCGGGWPWTAPRPAWPPWTAWRRIRSPSTWASPSAPPGAPTAPLSPPTWAVPEAHRPLPGRPVPGDPGRRGGPGCGGAAGAHRLLRRRHPHHPVRPPAGPADGGAARSHRPVRLHRVHGGGRSAGHHHGGKAGRPGPPGLRPDLRQPPVHVRRGAGRHGAGPPGGRYPPGLCLGAGERHPRW